MFSFSISFALVQNALVAARYRVDSEPHLGVSAEGETLWTEYGGRCAGDMNANHP